MITSVTLVCQQFSSHTIHLYFVFGNSEKINFQLPVKLSMHVCCTIVHSVTYTVTFTDCKWTSVHFPEPVFFLALLVISDSFVSWAAFSEHYVDNSTGAYSGGDTGGDV